MEFILENYMIIIIVGLFFVFALIGYLIDMIRKTNESEKIEMPNIIKPVEVKEINIKKDENIESNIEEQKDNKDELLENYEKEINE